MGEILIDFFKDYGYWGMFFMAFLSGSIIPAASEVLLVFFLGIGLDALTLTTVATIGNTIGGVSCFFLGYLGFHRFYVGKVGTGILQLLTFGGLGIWVLIDFIKILLGRFRDSEGRLIR